MKKREAGEKVTAKQGLLLLFAAVLVIVVCKIVFNVDTKTTLMLSGAIGGIICMIWGFKWEDIESKFAEGIKSTAMPIVLLIVIGMMVASWILSGTIPTMTYYGMKLLAPGAVFVLIVYFVLRDVSLHGYFLGNCFHSGRSTFGCGHGAGNSYRDDCRRHCGWIVFWRQNVSSV